MLQDPKVGPGHGEPDRTPSTGLCEPRRQPRAGGTVLRITVFRLPM